MIISRFNPQYSLRLHLFFGQRSVLIVKSKFYNHPFQFAPLEELVKNMQQTPQRDVFQ